MTKNLPGPRRTQLWPTSIATTTTLATYRSASESSALSPDKVTSGQALTLIFSDWLRNAMERTRERLTCTEPRSLAISDFQRLLASLAEDSDTLLPDAIYRAWQMRRARLRPEKPVDIDTSGETIAASDHAPRLIDEPKALRNLRRQLGRWSKVPGADIFRVLLSAEDNRNGWAEEVFAGLALCPNRNFAWRLLYAAGTGWPLAMNSFRQMLWVTRYEFIHDCIHDLGRPLPLMEIDEICGSTADLESIEQTFKLLLTPPEIAYCLAYGAMQMDFNPKGLPSHQVIGERPRPRLSLNPLFTQRRKVLIP